jgi:AI-2 transport protein TqsA
MTDTRSPSGPWAWLVGAAALVVIASGMRAAAWIVAPVALAAVLVVVVSPLRRILAARGRPGWVGAIAVYAALIGLLVGFALILVISVARLSTLVPQYADEASELAASIGARLEQAGVDGEQTASVVSMLDPLTLVRQLSSLVGSVANAAGGLALLVALLVFIAVDASTSGRRLTEIAGERPDLSQALRSFASGTRRYLLVATVFGLAVAILDGVALWLLAVPLPVLWALLAFVTNYIPNIGFLIGLIPPALLALLDGGLGSMLWVIGVYCVVNFVLQVMVQPKVVGDTVNLSVTLSFVAVIVWTWLIGGLGAVLAVPLTLLVKALLVDAAGSRSWNAVLAANSSLPREERLLLLAVRQRQRDDPADDADDDRAPEGRPEPVDVERDPELAGEPPGDEEEQGVDDQGRHAEGRDVEASGRAAHHGFDERVDQAEDERHRDERQRVAGRPVGTHIDAVDEERRDR